MTPCPAYPAATPSPRSGSKRTVAHQSRVTPSTPDQAWATGNATSGKNVCSRASSSRTVRGCVSPPAAIPES